MNLLLDLADLSLIRQALCSPLISLLSSFKKPRWSSGLQGYFSPGHCRV